MLSLNKQEKFFKKGGDTDGRLRSERSQERQEEGQAF